MKKSLIILGAGGHGRVVKETAEAMEKYDDIKFLDDDIKNTRISGTLNDYGKYKGDNVDFFIALGNSELRKKWNMILKSEKINIPNLIHPMAYVSPSVELGYGNVICAMSAINSNVIIGNQCIVGMGALIDHDAVIKEYSHINCGVVVKAREIIKI